MCMYASIYLSVFWSNHCVSKNIFNIHLFMSKYIHMHLQLYIIYSFTNIFSTYI